MTKIKKPDRHPDVMFPSDRNGCEVYIWIAENIFYCPSATHLDGNVYRNSMGGIKTALDYIRFIAYESSNEDKSTKMIALEYLCSEELEKAVFGE